MRPNKTQNCSALFFLILAINNQGCSEGPIRRTYEPSTASTAVIENHPNELIKKIQALYLRGEYAAALAVINHTSEEKILEADPAQFWNIKGLCLLAQKRPLLAEAAFRKALDENRRPEFKDYFNYNLAAALYEGKKPEESLAVLQAIELETLDATHQHKVLSLKNKILQTQENEISPSPLAPPPPGATLTSASPSPTPPISVYAGPVNPNRIGLLLPLSGKYESFGNRVKRTIELAFQQTELGKKVELITEDSGETPESHFAALQKLVEQDQVVAIIGPLLSKGIDLLATKAAEYQVPLFSIAQAQGPVSPQLFSCSISSHDQVVQVLDYAVNVKGMKRFAVIAPKNKSGEEFAKLFWDEADAKRAQIRAYEFYEPTDTDFRDPVDKSLGLYYQDARSKELEDLATQREQLKITKKTMKTQQYYNLPPIVDFDAVFIPDEARTVGQLIPTFAYRDADKLTYLGITSWNSSQLIQRAQNFVEKSVFPVAYDTLNPSAETQKFIKIFTDTYNGTPGEIEAIAYDSAKLMLAALEDHPSTRDEFRLKLEHPVAVEGGTGMVKLTEHRCVRKLTLYQVEKGKFVPARLKDEPGSLSQ